MPRNKIILQVLYRRFDEINGCFDSRMADLMTIVENPVGASVKKVYVEENCKEVSSAVLSLAKRFD